LGSVLNQQVLDRYPSRNDESNTKTSFKKAELASYAMSVFLSMWKRGEKEQSNFLSIRKREEEEQSLV
jgi:hypothetical protein